MDLFLFVILPCMGLISIPIVIYLKFFDKPKQEPEEYEDGDPQIEMTTMQKWDDLEALAFEVNLFVQRLHQNDLILNDINWEVTPVGDRGILYTAVITHEKELYDI